MPRRQEQDPFERIRAKEWRSLPQNVSVSGDTRASKRRRVRNASRTISVALLFAGIAALFGYVWADMMRGVSEEGAPGAAAAEFSSEGGVLDEAWFRAWTGFDESRAPNLNRLRRRLLEYPQIKEADIRRLPGGKIRVSVRERRPIGRLVGADGAVRLVADDGVIFPSETFPPSRAMLPIFEDAKISRDAGTGFERVEGIGPLVEFVDEARTRCLPIFAEWDVISLKHFPADPNDVALPWAEIRVVPKSSAGNPSHGRVREIVFSAEPKSFRQDLRLLSAAAAEGKLEEALSAPEARKKDYRILFITNRKNPAEEFRELRLIPVPAAGTR